MLQKTGESRSRDTPTEEQTVLDDIRYFETRLRALGEPASSRDTAAVQVYRLLIRQRRQLLAAIRDGEPDRWPQYLPDG